MVKIEKTTNNLYLSGANRGYEVRGRHVTLLGIKKGFLGGAHARHASA